VRAQRRLGGPSMRRRSNASPLPGWSARPRRSWTTSPPLTELRRLLASIEDRSLVTRHQEPHEGYRSHPLTLTSGEAGERGHDDVDPGPRAGGSATWSRG